MISDRAIDRLREAASWPELDARYEITGVAGHGGMGTVLRGTGSASSIARWQVKVLDVADERGSRARRLQREAHILARLDHPGIVPIHDAGTLEDGRAFYVMKLVKGRRLDDLDPRSDAAREPARPCSTASSMPSPVAHAHGVVHRDLKPDNVMVGAFGEGLRDGLGRRTGRRRRRGGGGRHAGLHGPLSRRWRARSIRAPTSMRSACCSRS
jgi:serine/threonine protein kinase